MRKTFLLKSLIIACLSSLFGGGNALAQKYVETPATELKTGDIIVIVDKTTANALPNDITGKAPVGTAVTLNSDQSQIESTVSSSLKWEVEVTTNESVTTYKFKISDSENYLYVKNTNDGVRIGDAQASTDNSFIWDADNNKLKCSTFARWIGVYTKNPDWRCYTSATQANINSTVTAFYKLVDTGKAPADIKYETTEYTALLGQAFETPTLTNPNNLTPTYSIECTPTEVAEINETTGDVTIKAVGKAVVTAKTAEDDTYDAGQASYTITIRDPNQATYSKVTSTEELIAGATYIIVNEANNVALGLINSSNNGDAVTINIENDVATVDSENSGENPYEITLGGTSGAYTLTTAQCSIGVTDGKNTFSTTDNTIWNITFTTQGNATISNTSNDYEIRYNNSMGAFRVYSASSGTLKVQLYKKDIAISTGSLTIGDEKFATFYSDNAYVMPEGVTGGIITAADETEGTLTVDYRYTAGSTVPAKTALLLKGETKTYTFDYSASTDVAPTGNLLHGADAVDANGYTYVEGTNVRYYILSNNQAGTDFGFYWAAGNGAAVKYQAPFAFLAIDFGNKQSAPKMFSLDGGENTSGITAIESTDNVADGRIYTVTGAYVSKDRNNLPKGIYIVNGKKIAVK